MQWKQKIIKISLKLTLNDNYLQTRIHNGLFIVSLQTVFITETIQIKMLVFLMHFVVHKDTNMVKKTEKIKTKYLLCTKYNEITFKFVKTTIKSKGFGLMSRPLYLHSWKIYQSYMLLNLPLEVSSDKKYQIVLRYAFRILIIQTFQQIMLDSFMYMYIFFVFNAIMNL